jgi:integrase
MLVKPKSEFKSLLASAVNPVIRTVCVPLPTLVMLTAAPAGRGSIRRRGKRSWELRFDVGADDKGKRKVACHSFKGSKVDAEAKLAEVIAATGRGEYIAPNKQTVGAFVASRITAWRGQQIASGKTAERYGELLKNQIAPHLGALPLRKLSDGLAVGDWHGKLLTAGLAPQTVKHAHRLLCRALSDVKIKLTVAAPKVPERDMTIMEPEQAEMVLEQLIGNSLLPMVATALFAGLRRGELLALRWNAVDVDGGKLVYDGKPVPKPSLAVVASVEQLAGGKLTFKKPKTKAGKRLIRLPEPLIAILRAHRVEQMQLRLKLGQGRLADNALLFSDIEGTPLSPRAVSKRWAAFADKVGVGHVRLHDLRHCHATLLHNEGVPPAVVSKRLGHTKIRTSTPASSPMRMIRRQKH